MKYASLNRFGSWSLHTDTSIKLPEGALILDDVQYDELVNGSLVIVNGVIVPTTSELPDLVSNVKNKCLEILQKKISNGFLYSGNLYQIDRSSQDNIGKRAIYAGWSVQDPITFPWIEPYSLGWWDVNNTWHQMSAQEFTLFAKAVSDYVSACTACCRNHQNSITLENCETYDYTAGWPLN